MRCRGFAQPGNRTYGYVPCRGGKLLNEKYLAVNYSFTYLTILLFLSSLPSVLAQPGSQTRYINVQSNVWHLEVWDTSHVATADYNGNVALKNLSDGASVWNYPTQAFVFDLKLGDIDQDGRQETAVVTAQGELLLLNAEGKRMWSFQSSLPLYNVVIGNLVGDGNLEIACGGIDRFVYILDHQGKLLGKSASVERLVHRLATGNLDDDAYDELLVIEDRTVAHVMDFDRGVVRSVWRKPLRVPNENINWENPAGKFFAFSVHIDDLDGDGVNEILLGDTFFNKQAVMVVSRSGEPRWISDGVPPFSRMDASQTEFYSTAFVRSADIFPEIAGKEVVSVAGSLFRIWTSDGRLLGAKNAAVGFTDLEAKGNQLYLASCPNGDDHIYTLAIDSTWQAEVAQLQFRGKIQRIKENTARIKQLIINHPAMPVSDKQYDIRVGFGSVVTTPEGLLRHQEQERWFRRKYPYDNLRVVRQIKAMEHTPPVDASGKPWSPERWRVDALHGTQSVREIVEQAAWIEQQKIPTYFYIGHSCMPFISLATVDKVMNAAPTYCLGFLTAEDEQIERLPRYMADFFRPLTQLGWEQAEKIASTKNKGTWWMSSPSIPEVYQALFEYPHRKVVMAATEDSNSRTPELNLMGRGGLWQAGLLTHNEVSIHGDLFSFNRFHQWEYPKAGHPYLRLLVAHTTLGMTHVAQRIRENPPHSDQDTFKAIDQESTELFYHLLGKGIVFSPDRKDILGYSPLGIVVHQPSEKWLTDAHNGHAPERWVDDEELHRAVFPHNGSLWGMTNTPEHAFQKVIFNKERQFGMQLPPTPYGLVAFVPEHANRDSVAHVHDWWHTDGTYVWKNEGQKYTGQEAANRLRADFEAAANQLPFRQEGDAVFMQTVRMAEGHYRLFLVDPGWINPQDRDVTVRVQLPGEYRVTNVLNNTPHSVANHRFSTTVPAGLFTILDVYQEN